MPETASEAPARPVPLHAPLGWEGQRLKALVVSPFPSHHEIRAQVAMPHRLLTQWLQAADLSLEWDTGFMHLASGQGTPISEGLPYLATAVREYRPQLIVGLGKQVVSGLGKDGTEFGVISDADPAKAATVFTYSPLAFLHSRRFYSLWLRHAEAVRLWLEEHPVQ